MVGSWTDWNLSALGVEQAKRIGEHMKEFVGDRQFVMYASDLKRAKQTAEIIGEKISVTPVLRSELRERNLGKCCGKSVRWLRENIEKQENTVDDKMFSDAESRRDEWNRLKPFFDEILTSADENIIIVSHGDLLSVFNTMFCGSDIESMNYCEMFGHAGGVSLMVINDDGKRIVKRMSDMSFLM